MKIKLTKFAAVDNPHYPTPNKKDYKYGQENGGCSVPVDYYIVGHIEDKPKVGQGLRVLRTNRNGIECTGYFTSSKITAIDGDIISTLNSKYRLDYLDEK